MKRGTVTVASPISFDNRTTTTMTMTKKPNNCRRWSHVPLLKSLCQPASHSALTNWFFPCIVKVMILTRMDECLDTLVKLKSARLITSTT